MDIWETLLEHYGTQAQIARVCGVRDPSVHDRRKRRTPLPAEWARAIHDDSGIPLHELRPDLWPEPEATT